MAAPWESVLLSRAKAYLYHRRICRLYSSMCSKIGPKWVPPIGIRTPMDTHIYPTSIVMPFLYIIHTIIIKNFRPHRGQWRPWRLASNNIPHPHRFTVTWGRNRPHSTRQPPCFPSIILHHLLIRPDNGPAPRHIPRTRIGPREFRVQFNPSRKFRLGTPTSGPAKQYIFNSSDGVAWPVKLIYLLAQIWELTSIDIVEWSIIVC